jgi:uncharacterized membrane protein
MTRKMYNSSRISALSDGVFSIAMTLLVFNIQISDLSEVKAGPEFRSAIVEQLPHIFSWLLSFAILCRLWITHNHLMSDHSSKSAGFTAWNFLLLGAVAFIPFPASLLGEHPDQRWSVIMLSVSYAAAALAMAGMWYVAPNRGSDRARKVRMVSIIMMSTAILSCLLTLIHPYLGIGIWMIYLLGVLPLSHYIAEKRAHLESKT